MFLSCITCNRQVQQAIWGSTFFPNLLTMMSAFIFTAVVVVLLSVISTRRHRTYLSSNPSSGRLSPVPLTTAAMVLGIGAGGFVDGIVLHQILQWHEMISNKMPPINLIAKSVNMFWDGVFHFFTLLVTLVGIILLWKVGRRSDAERSGRLLSGGMLTGWAIFNIGEGIIDHHILKLHNVRELSSNPDAWNWGFLGFSLLLLFIGSGIARSRRLEV